MLKNIYISGLVFILLISTTGLTYSFHLCKMMSEEEAELCEMEDMKIMTGCCSEGKEDGHIIKSYEPDCCEFQTVEKKVSDQFLTIKIETNKENTLTVNIVNAEILNNNLYTGNSDRYAIHNNSPPGRENNLFIINSSFLI
jgi:hypothetical protein